MGNMSYCRFQNTRSDLSDCVDALEESEDLNELDLSEEELRAAKSMHDLCILYIEEYRRLHGITE